MYSQRKYAICVIDVINSALLHVLVCLSLFNCMFSPPCLTSEEEFFKPKGPEPKQSGAFATNRLSYAVMDDSPPDGQVSTFKRNTSEGNYTNVPVNITRICHFM